MAWPFTTAVAPTYNSGLVPIPTSLTQILAGNPWLLGVMFVNNTSAAINVTVQDTNGYQIVPTVEVPANMDITRSYAFPPCAGPLKWQASGSGLAGQVWGYV